MSEDTEERERAKQEKRAIIAARLDRVMERVERENPGDPHAAVRPSRSSKRSYRGGGVGLGKRVGALEEFVESQVQERMRSLARS